MTLAEMLAENVNIKYGLAKQQYFTVNDFIVNASFEGNNFSISLMNLTVVDGSVIRPKFLRDAIKEIDDKYLIKHVHRKDLSEYSSLYFYLHYFPSFKFRKSESPDFILLDPNNNQIGLEIVHSITLNEAISEKIAKMCFGRNQDFTHILEYAKSKYVNVENTIEINQVNNQTYISPTKGLSDCRYFKQLILKNAITKANKQKKYQKLNKLYVLIDTTSGIGFDSINDANEVKTLFDMNIDKLQNVNKFIIVNRNDNILMEYTTENMKMNFWEENGLTTAST
ncbi:MAG: hypothetical protein GX677_08105 [Treponema sp.]|jgi:hypothetical protein|nr:hypothetical protein [Treponema sp.]